MKNIFIVFGLISSVSLNAMEELDFIPTVKEAKEKDRVTREYVVNLTIEYTYRFNDGGCIAYARMHHNDWKTPIIKRFAETVIERAFVLREPKLQKLFKELYKKPETRDHAYYTLRVIKEDTEALRSVLADRSLITYILRGTTDQPWLTRPEFDQEWSAIRKDIKLEQTIAKTIVTKNYE